MSYRPFVDASFTFLRKNTLLQGQDIVNMTHYDKNLGPK